MSYFTAESLGFLRGIAQHNSKPWFERHRADYERYVKEPMAELVQEMDIRMSRFGPEITGDPKRSLFRLHRDIRFSKDKSPYKTHAACWFYHADGSSKVGREAHGGGAGFYFHLQPGASFVGGGCWMPPRPALNRFRAEIAKNARAFERTVLAPKLRRRMGALSEDSMLKRVPRGYAEDHAAAKWLRYQSFTVGRRLTNDLVTSARLTATLESDFVLMLPLVRWLNAALGLAPKRRR